LCPYIEDSDSENGIFLVKKCMVLTEVGSLMAVSCMSHAAGAFVAVAEADGWTSCARTDLHSPSSSPTCRWQSGEARGLCCLPLSFGGGRRSRRCRHGAELAFPRTNFRGTAAEHQHASTRRGQTHYRHIFPAVLAIASPRCSSLPSSCIRVRRLGS
jgi:hypothetical protein